MKRHLIQIVIIIFAVIFTAQFSKPEPVLSLGKPTVKSDPILPLGLPPAPKPIKPIAQVAAQPIAELQPIPVPQPVAPAPVTGCGSDPNMAFIYEHESGCSTGSINAGSGACGLGQALPCSKMGCSLGDWACQDNFFRNYAISSYGSTYAAMLFWEGHHWW